MINKYNVKHTRQSAFTFLELMITVTILSVGLVFVLRAFSTTIKASSFSQEMTEACLLAEGKISELELFQENGEEVFDQGQGETDNLTWNYELTPVEDSDLSMLRFRVLSKRAKRGQILEIVTYFSKPSS